MGSNPIVSTEKVLVRDLRLCLLREQPDELPGGTGRDANTAIGEAARRLRTAEHNREQAQHSATAPGFSRRDRRASVRLVDAWSAELAHARNEWAAVAGPTECQLLDALADAEDVSSRLGTQRTLQALDRISGHGIHARIAAIDRELESVDSPLREAASATRPEISTRLGRSL